MAGRADARALSMEASEAIADGRAGYLQAVETLLTAALGCDLVMWNDVDLKLGTATIAGRERAQWEWLIPTVARLAPQNAMALHFLNSEIMPPAVRMSDLVEVLEFRGTPVFNELFRAMGAGYQMGVPTARSAFRYARGWAFNRANRDFTESELSTARGLQPALSMLEDVVFDSHAYSEADQLEDPRWELLTPREREVVTLVARGWTARHIGHVLRISPATVRKHLERVYGKLGTHDRALTVTALADAIKRRTGHGSGREVDVVAGHQVPGSVGKMR